MGACELESGDAVPAAIAIRKMTIGITQTLLPTNGRRITMPDAITGDRPELKPVNIGAAAIDIGSKMHVAAVNPTCTDVPVRAFGTFTQDLHDMADWFKACGVTSVAMESTGVYWIPPYEILEQHGVKPCLVDARGMKNVPGRRTDWHECQWIQFLHSVGLLRAAFRPDGDVCAVRVLMRHRSDLVQMTSQHIQHMQKSLTQMNVQIHHVISDITGLTGLAIVD